MSLCAHTLPTNQDHFRGAFHLKQTSCKVVSVIKDNHVRRKNGGDNGNQGYYSHY